MLIMNLSVFILGLISLCRRLFSGVGVEKLDNFFLGCFLTLTIIHLVVHKNIIMGLGTLLYVLSYLIAKFKNKSGGNIDEFLSK